MMIRKLMLAALALPALAAGPAYAQSDETKPLDISFSLTGVTDYRFRGVSLSDKDPAIQPQISINHESGLYFTAWGSNIADNGGDDIEIDLTAGISRDIGNVNINAGAVYYLYPGVSDYNYVELLGSVGTSLGKSSVALNVAYAPSQANIGDTDNFYIAVSGTHALTEKLTLNGSFGLENGAFADHKKDWSIGADYDVGHGIVVGAKYIDTAHTDHNPLAKPTAVLSVSKSF
ncbi:MAG: TorF family putative porin [Chakrabartia sp.]